MYYSASRAFVCLMLFAICWLGVNLGIVLTSKKRSREATVSFAAFYLLAMFFVTYSILTLLRS